MTGIDNRPKLALEPDFKLGSLHVSPSASRVIADGKEERIEAQTMTVLIVLARAQGATVSREDLIACCWQGRVVSDDAVTRTIAKVRALARGIEPPPFVLETLPKIGYRLTAHEADSLADGTLASALATQMPRNWPLVATLAGLIMVVAVAFTFLPRQPSAATTSTAAANLPTAAQVSEALTLLDRDRVGDFLERGWDPNWKLDSEGSNSLQTLFMACERNPSHDRGMVAVIAQMLVKAGVDATARNKWDDSALDIAISPRYCGPHHPVVDFLKSMAPPEEITRVMTRACGEAFGGKPSQARWANSTLTRKECEAAMPGKL